jgi:NADP-dependent 3-hydroxy acid dehydrogenase YdfG
MVSANPNGSIQGKAIVIAGGTTGIGRATARLLAEHGGRVLICGRKEEDLKEALREAGAKGECHGVTADISQQADVERVFREADEKLGGVDVLVNCAAVSDPGLFKSRFPDWRYALETNILGYIACTHEAVERMRRKGEGHLVNIGSMSADLREAGGPIYSATKAAVQAFSESLRKTVNKENIRVSLIEPGAVATPLQEKPPEQEREMIEKMEMLEPDEIAESVYYVLSQPTRCDVVMVQIRPTKQLI